MNELVFCRRVPCVQELHVLHCILQTMRSEGSHNYTKTTKYCTSTSKKIYYNDPSCIEICRIFCSQRLIVAIMATECIQLQWYPEKNTRTVFSEWIIFFFSNSFWLACCAVCGPFRYPEHVHSTVHRKLSRDIWKNSFSSNIRFCQNIPTRF